MIKENERGGKAEAKKQCLKARSGNEKETNVERKRDEKKHELRAFSVSSADIQNKKKHSNKKHIFYLFFSIYVIPGLS